MNYNEDRLIKVPEYAGINGFTKTYGPDENKNADLFFMYKPENKSEINQQVPEMFEKISAALKVDRNKLRIGYLSTDGILPFTEIRKAYPSNVFILLGIPPSNIELKIENRFYFPFQFYGSYLIIGDYPEKIMESKDLKKELWNALTSIHNND